MANEEKSATPNKQEEAQGKLVAGIRVTGRCVVYRGRFDGLVGQFWHR